ncbi:UNKNOWN [Stylonychia lemnae]|uniref:Transmembrane protein n=1 Tax=Stylonychia lemnae TaxID=5949 RepID=A0A077ZWS9_STYLE|nr:UNKNOWN [Stylonychia lemnae]|eukprot:CDW74051.1 UNKNOWN [Stylonychia lemnae]
MFNSIVGINFYSFLTISDHLVLGIIIIVSSYPTTTYYDYIDTRNFSIFAFYDSTNTIIAINALFSFTLVQLPIQNSNLPWVAIFPKYLVIKEIVKALVVAYFNFMRTGLDLKSFSISNLQKVQMGNRFKQFKKNDENHNRHNQLNNSKKGIGIKNIVGESSISVNKTTNIDLTQDNFIPFSHQNYDATDQNDSNGDRKVISRQSDWIEASQINIDFQLQDGLEQKSISENQKERIVSQPYASPLSNHDQVQTYSFDTNLIVTGISIDDMFKEVFEIENINQKMMNNSHILLNIHGNSNQQKNQDKNMQGKKIKFKDQKEA